MIHFLQKLKTIILSYGYVRVETFHKRIEKIEATIDQSINPLGSHQVFLMKEMLSLAYDQYKAPEKVLDMLKEQSQYPLNPCPIVLIADKNYKEAVFTTAFSILHHQGDTRYKIYILTDTESSQEFSEICDLNGDITIKAVENQYKDWPITHQHVSKAALIKFDLPNLFPEYSKLLYLDSDTVVLDNIDTLLNLELAENYLAAVEDFPIVPGIPVPNLKRYFNSGVMLMNLNKMREDNIPEKLAIQRKYDPRKQFMDQNSFNIVCANNFISISPAYNLLYHNIYNSAGFENRFASFYQLEQNQALKILQNPCIFHYTNRQKPWNSIKCLQIEHWLKENIMMKKTLALVHASRITSL